MLNMEKSGVGVQFKGTMYTDQDRTKTSFGTRHSVRCGLPSRVLAQNEDNLLVKPLLPKSAIQQERTEPLRSGVLVLALEFCYEPEMHCAT